MLTVNLLEPRDWSSGQVPDSVEHISSMDPIVVCQSKNERSVSVNLTTDSMEGSGSGSGWTKLETELTGNVPVAIFQGVEIQHELPDWDLEDFKQTHVLKERVRHLWRHKHSQRFQRMSSHIS